ncbi:MAG: D-aminoacyl-tRNA deacylase [Chloroflexota bacterium]
MARLVAQRIVSASVSVDTRTTGSIGKGLLIFLGIRRGDNEADVQRLADKVAVMRIFEDDLGKMNLNIAEAGGDFLVVSQFTLYADLRKGRRPSFTGAAEPADGLRLYESFIQHLQSHGHVVERGEFGEHMLVTLENDGPVTIIFDSEEA